MSSGTIAFYLGELYSMIFFTVTFEKKHEEMTFFKILEGQNNGKHLLLCLFGLRVSAVRMSSKRKMIYPKVFFPRDTQPKI